MKVTKRKKQTQWKILYGATTGLAAAGLALVAIPDIVTSDYVDAASDVVTTINPAGYSISIASNDVALNVDAVDDGGFASTTSTVRVTTNTTGYELYMAASRDNSTSGVVGNALYRGGDFSASNSYYLAPTTNSNAALSTNSWGYSTNSGAASANNYYNAVPIEGSETRVGQLTGNTNGTTKTTDHSIYYGAYADLDMPAGDYSGTVIYSAVAEASVATSDLISISPNYFLLNDAGTAISGNSTVTIITPLATMLDYGTVTATIGGSTCTNVNAYRNSDGLMELTCTAPVLANGTYDVVVTESRFHKTYTLNKAVSYTNKTLQDITNMQEMTPAICANTTTPKSSATATTNDKTASSDYVQQKSLKDTRDNHTYVVRKLADGNCWMSQNLDLALTTSSGAYATTITDDGSGNKVMDETGLIAKTLTSADTDLNDGLTSWTPNHVMQAYATGGQSVKWAQNGSDGARSFENGNVYIRGGNSFSTSYTTPSSTGYEWEHMGNYYNWFAATAGSGYGSYDSSTGTYATVASGNAKSSICPKGWRLPSNDASGDYNQAGASHKYSFTNLVNTVYGITNGTHSTANDAQITLLSLSRPLDFVRSGYYGWGDGALNGRGTYGYWWSSHTYEATGAHSLLTYSTWVYSQNGNSKGYGFTIRCVAW